MKERIKQVIAALTAKILPQDREFIARHLNTKEAMLFWGMNLPDQRHALNVAYTAIDLASKCSGLDKEALVKASLLHDVGKVKGDVSTTDKIIAVLCDKYAPAKARSWGRFGRGGKLDNIRHALFIYYNHPARSAVFLQNCGVSDKIVRLAAEHHAEPSPEDSPELVILRQADRLN